MGRIDGSTHRVIFVHNVVRAQIQDAEWGSVVDVADKKISQIALAEKLLLNRFQKTQCREALLIKVAISFNTGTQYRVPDLRQFTQ